MQTCGLALAGSSLPAPAADDAAPEFPLRASASGRYLVDGKGRPFFYHADTAWAAVKKLSPAEIEEYLDDRLRRGFTAVHLHTVSKEVGPMTNQEGVAPFDPPHDILRPVESYWQRLDGAVAAAQKRAMLAAISALWIRWGGTDKEGWRGELTNENARAYGTFLGQRYRRFPNIVWILGGDANPGDRLEAIHQLAAGLREAAPHHLLTVHNAPEHASTAFFSEAPWLGINFAYTYREVAPHVQTEYRRAGQPRPIVLGESGYEEESNDKRGGDPFRMRRQAYGAVLNGALGGHAFGQRHVWRMDAQWREALNSPASQQMAHVKSFFTSRAWWRLVPDLTGEFVTSGRGAVEDVSFVSAAVAEDGSFALAYLPTERPVTLNLQKLRGVTPLAQWFDPTNGVSQPATMQEGRFAPPGRNSAGESDWALVLQ